MFFSSMRAKVKFLLATLFLISILSTYLLRLSKNIHNKVSHELSSVTQKSIHSKNIEFLLSKLFNASAKESEVIKDELKLEISKIDQIHQRKSEHFYIPTLIIHDHIDDVNRKSLLHWNESVKASIELIVDLGADEIDNETKQSLYYFLNEFNNQIQKEYSEFNIQAKEVISITDTIQLFVNGTLLLIVLFILLVGLDASRRFDIMNSRIQNWKPGKNLEDSNNDIGHDEIANIYHKFALLVKNLEDSTVSKDHLENILESMNDALFTVDKDNNILIANNSASMMVGYDQAALKEMNFSAFLSDSIDLESTGAHGNKEIEIIGNEEKKTSCLVSKSKIGNEEDSHILYVLKDMTELNEIKKQLDLEQAKSIQASKLATLGEMAGGVAHEINNPLAIISGFSEKMVRILKKENLENAEINKCHEKISKNVHRIKTIVSGLRKFARDGSDDMFEEISVKEIVVEALELCQERMKHLGIVVRGISDLDPNLKILGQAIPLSQIFVNLFNNSRDAIENLDEKWISVELTEENDQIIVHFTDSGNGIPEDIRDKVLEPFFTTKPVGVGTGLGLGIAVGIIEKHDGNIIIDPDCANTRFTITFPKIKSQVSPAA